MNMSLKISKGNKVSVRSRMNVSVRSRMNVSVRSRMKTGVKRSVDVRRKVGVKAPVYRRVKECTEEVKVDIFNIALGNHTWIKNEYYFWKWVCILSDHSGSIVERNEFNKFRTKWEGKKELDGEGFGSHMERDEKMAMYRKLCKK
jgi:hypothetical protein